MSTLQSISWAMTGTLAIFLVFGFLWGMIRGLKKTAIRGMVLLIVIITLFFLSSVITKMLFQFNVQNMNLSVNGKPITTLGTYIYQLIVSALPDFDFNSVALYNLIYGVTTIFLNVFIFVLLFWLLKVLSLPIYWIIAAITNKKFYVDTVDGKQVNIKVRKNRLLGGFVGMVMGLFICMFTTMPVLGYIKLVNENSQKVYKQLNDEQVLNMKYYFDYTEMIEQAYQSSMLAYTYKYTGMELLSDFTFDMLSTTNINDIRVNLKDEIESVLTASGMIIGREEFNLQECTQQELTTQLNFYEQVVDVLFESKIVQAAGELAMPVVVDYVYEMINVQDMSEYVAPIVSTALSSVKKYKMTDVQTDIKQIIRILRYMNNNDLLIPLIRGEIENTLDYVQLYTKDVVKPMINAFLLMNTVDDVAPAMINSLTKFLGKGLNTQVEEVKDVENFKVAFNNILVAAVEVISYIDLDSKIYIDYQGLSNVGVLVDSIDNSKIFPANIHDQFVDACEQRLISLVNTFGSLPDYLKVNIETMIENVSEVENWIAEFATIQSGVDCLFRAIEDFQNTKNIEDLDWQELGKSLDYLKSTDLIKNDKQIIHFTAYNLMYDVIKDTDFYKYQAVKDYLFKVQYYTINKTHGWENELKYIPDLITYVKALQQGAGIYENIKDPNNDDIVQLGYTLDKCQDNALLGNDKDYNIIDTFLKEILTEIAQDNVDPSLKKPFDMMIENIGNSIDKYNTISWGNEFGYLKDLIQLEDSAITLDSLKDIGQTLDEIIEAQSVLITNEVINEIVSGAVEDFFTPTMLADQAVEKMYNQLIARLGDSEKYKITSYVSEFDAITKLSEVNDTTWTIDNITDLATVFDSIQTSVWIGNAGSIILQDKIADYEFSGTDEQIVFGTIMDNLKNVQSDAEGLTTPYYDFCADLKEVNDFINNLPTIDINNVDEIEVILDELQSNITLLAQGSRQIGNIIIKDIITAMEDKITDVTANPDVPQTTKDFMDNLLLEIKVYNQYLLDSDLEVEPYLQETVVTKDVIYNDQSYNVQINMFFTYLHNNILALNDVDRLAHNLSDTMDGFTGGLQGGVDLTTLDDTLSKLQINDACAVDGAREIALSAIDQILAKLQDEKDSNAQVDSLDSYTNLYDYLTDYKAYLTYNLDNSVTDDEPFVSDSVITTDTSLQISNPFEHITTLIDALVSDIDNLPTV